MKLVAIFVSASLVTGIAAISLNNTAPAVQEGFTLDSVIPDDAFLFVAGKVNPEREFLDRYWEEIFDEMTKSGVGEDVFGLIQSLLGANEQAEAERFKELISKLLAGVDWEQLGSNEFVFAERFGAPIHIPGGGLIVKPQMLWLFRGVGDGAAQNYDGLVEILEAAAAEINRAAGEGALTVERSSLRKGALTIATLKIGKQSNIIMPLAVARHEELIVIASGEAFFGDCLDLLVGNGSVKSLRDNARFRNAFAELPPAEDEMMFFDMQALLKQMTTLLTTIRNVVDAPHDVYKNAGMSDEVGILNGQVLAAAKKGNHAEALALIVQANELSPNNSIILYNRACMNAVLGNKSEALSWLDKAVDAGFYAPEKIEYDSDLDSIRDDAGYKATVEKAAQLAQTSAARDVVINAPKDGEVHALRMQIDQAYKHQDFALGLKLSEQAYVLAPNNARVLYSMAFHHALLGHQEKAFEFLNRAVDGGFYCPQHISKDPDWKGMKDLDRFKAAVAKAREHAAKYASERSTDHAATFDKMTARIANALVLDYSAAVSTTDGFTTRGESISVLVTDAKERPIYPVFGNVEPMTNFDQFLPQETESFSVSSGVNLGELYEFLEDTILEAGPDGQEVIAKWKGIQQKIGLDVRKDVFDWIEGSIVSATLAKGGGSVLLIKVSDESAAHEKVGAAIDFLSTQLSEMIESNPKMAMLAMIGIRTSPVQDEQLEGFENIYFAMAPQPAVWGVTQGHLVFGSSANAVRLCLATAKGDHPNIKSNTRVMNEAIVPDGAFTSVSLTDYRNLGKEIAAGIGGVSMGIGMMGAFIPSDEARPILSKVATILGKLAPVAQKIDFYKSTASCTTFDGLAWRARYDTHYVSPSERIAKGPR